MIEDSRRFECTTGGHNKFYEISEPHAVGNPDEPGRPVDWVVNVEYARIGKSHQSHVYVRQWEGAAWALYQKKIREKIGKGYVEVTRARAPRAPTRPQRAPVRRPEPPPCPHDHLIKKGNKYTCQGCKTVVEFGLRQEEHEAQVFTKVRRFINLKNRRAA